MGSSTLPMCFSGKVQEIPQLSYFLFNSGNSRKGCIWIFCLLVFLWFVCHWNDCFRTETQNKAILNKRTDRQLQVSSQAPLLIQSVYDEPKLKDVFILKNVFCWMKIQIGSQDSRVRSFFSSCISFFLRNRNVKVTSMFSCQYQHHTLWYQSSMSPQSSSAFPRLFTPLWSGCGQLHGCFGWLNPLPVWTDLIFILGNWRCGLVNLTVSSSAT